MKSVEQNRRSLTWLIDLAQRSESEWQAGMSETRLRQFANSFRPQLQVDWDAETFGAPPDKPLKMMKRRKPAPPVKGQACVQCGQPGVYYSPPTPWNPPGSWHCELHEATARKRDAEDSESDNLMPGLEAVNPLKDSERPMARPQGTDVSALSRDVLIGLKSFLANSEWTFPPLTLTPTVSLGSGKRGKPERYMTGSLRDVVLAGISDLLMGHGHKIRPCKARGCDKAFLAIRRQLFCSHRCASNTSSDRFQKKLGRKRFRERRHRYYVEKMQRLYGLCVKVKQRKPEGR